MKQNYGDRDADLLKHFSTKELVQELMFREGVDTKVIEPHLDTNISVSGPAIVLIVID